MTKQLPVLDFVAAMPGFPDHHRFILVRLEIGDGPEGAAPDDNPAGNAGRDRGPEDDGMLYELTSVEDPDLRFLVVPPSAFFPGYSPELPDDALAALGVTSAESYNLLLLLVLTVGETPGMTTANLLAPIVLDRKTRHAIQVVLTGSGLSTRAELPLLT